MPDDWEAAGFSSLVRDGDRDWDGDGLGDRDETWRAPIPPTQVPSCACGPSSPAVATL
ncbi:MAG: hypothetical protein M5U12_35895 [Verrucomicrobia bacterium]|nr:hypothetical protein [Verrucomicrobiota bacterium]